MNCPFECLLNETILHIYESTMGYLLLELLFRETTSLKWRRFSEVLLASSRQIIPEPKELFLGWQSLEDRRRYSHLPLMFKIINNEVDTQWLLPNTGYPTNSPFKLKKFPTSTSQNSVLPVLIFPRTIQDWNNLQENIIQIKKYPSFQATSTISSINLSHPRTSLAAIPCWDLPIQELKLKLKMKLS